MTRPLARSLPFAWPRLLGVAVLLLACASAGSVPFSLASVPAGAAETAVSAPPVSTAADVTLPAVSPLRTVPQRRLLAGASGVVLAVACCLGPRMLRRHPTAEPPRAAPGRRGRALLHAYLN